MNYQLIYQWLELPADCSWPPEPHVLLGLQPGEANVHLIEQRVHERLEKVRRYQLLHPELATEAMNRLAGALIALSEKPGTPESPPEPTAAPAPAVAEAPPDPLAAILGVSLLPAVARFAAEAAGGASSEPAATSSADVEAASAAAATSPESAPPDPLELTVRTSVHARRGLGTKQGLYYRIVRTRRLLTAWDRLGPFLADAEDRVQRPQDALELRRQLEAVRQLLQDFPPLLGEASQVGYHVLTLARQPETVPTYKKLAPGQREILARDWQAGRRLLLAHRKVLRQQARTLRRGSWLERTSRALSTSLTENVGRVLLNLGLLALALALAWHQTDPRILVTILAAFVGLSLAVWWPVIWLPEPAQPSLEFIRASSGRRVSRQLTKFNR